MFVVHREWVGLYLFSIPPLSVISPFPLISSYTQLATFLTVRVQEVRMRAGTDIHGEVNLSVNGRPALYNWCQLLQEGELKDLKLYLSSTLTVITFSESQHTSTQTNAWEYCMPKTCHWRRRWNSKKYTAACLNESLRNKHVIYMLLQCNSHAISFQIPSNLSTTQ